MGKLLLGIRPVYFCSSTHPKTGSFAKTGHNTSDIPLWRDDFQVKNHAHLHARLELKLSEAFSQNQRQKRKIHAIEGQGREMESRQIKLQLDCQSARRTRNINFASNQKGYDNSETTVGKLSARRIQI